MITVSVPIPSSACVFASLCQCTARVRMSDQNCTGRRQCGEVLLAIRVSGPRPEGPILFYVNVNFVMKLSIFAVAGLLSTVSCAPATHFTIHERRQAGDSTWLPRDVELDRRTVLPISIGLTQQNLHKGHDFLMDVSDPNSPNYANHWTAEQV